METLQVCVIMSVVLGRSIMFAHNQEKLGITVPSFRLAPPLKWENTVFGRQGIPNDPLQKKLKAMAGVIPGIG